jgi:hypothetical protein
MKPKKTKIKEKKITKGNVAHVPRYQIGNVASVPRYQIGNMAHMPRYKWNFFFLFLAFIFLLHLVCIVFLFA